MNHLRKIQSARPVFSCSVRVSHHMASRIYYPARVTAWNDQVLNPQALPHGFDALYQNALGFLEAMREDEAIR